MNEYIHGISSDPLTILVILLSALIHDADHRGVPNVQLGKEQPKMASFYKYKSVAEQNSLNVAWDLLMSDQFYALHSLSFCIQGSAPTIPTSLGQCCFDNGSI